MDALDLLSDAAASSISYLNWRERLAWRILELLFMDPYPGSS
jgi:hypothetical protein